MTGDDVMVPTPQDLRQEVESGPFAVDLASAWADVFPAEPEPPAADKPAAPAAADDPKSAAAWAAFQARRRWERIRPRFGGLTPDAVHAIHATLANPTLRTRVKRHMSRGTFLAAIAPLAIAAVGAADAVRTKWATLLNLATGGDDEVDVTRPELQGLFDVAVADGLMTAKQRDALKDAGRVACSRLDELGWTGVTADLVLQAKAVA